MSEAGSQNAQQDVDAVAAEEMMVEDEADNISIVARYFQNRSNPQHSPFKWEYMAKWLDKKPFVGYRFPATGFQMYTTDSIAGIARDMYLKLSSTSDTDLSLKPANAIQTTTATDIYEVLPDWLRLDASDYKNASHNKPKPPTVLNISRLLSCLLAEPEAGTKHAAKKATTVKSSAKRFARSVEFKVVEEARKAATAVVAQELVNAHPELIECIPVRFDIPNVKPYEEAEALVSKKAIMFK
ncbi:hypothetical protein CC86DRAFT_410121 [Ophiobolus disseminans]|uniref:Uncharacterized protein n=1 Tax=Ophiobolus disseminans TaxID=1469910 RepID=A0A6A6ZN58_9PLEO|nr:hypothetical protein CC86DRAFT_410121 [Ophiobolus disseminans]